MSDRNWIAYIPYYGDNIVSDFNMKESDHIKLWNIKENKDINHLHYHYSELLVAYSIWTHQIKHDYICLWDHRRYLTPIGFDKLDNNCIQVYYHAYTELTPFEYMIHEGINEYIIWQFIKYMIEYHNVDHDKIIDLIFYKQWLGKLWFHSCFNCNWKVFNNLCNFIFGFLNYIMPNGNFTSKEDCDIFINDMSYSESYIRSISKENEIIEGGRIEGKDRPFANLYELLLPLYCDLIGYETFSEYDNKIIGIELNTFNKDTIIQELKKWVSKNVWSGCRRFVIKTNNKELETVVKNNWYSIYHAPLEFYEEFPENTIQIKINEYINTDTPISSDYKIITF